MNDDPTAVLIVVGALLLLMLIGAAIEEYPNWRRNRLRRRVDRATRREAKCHKTFTSST